MTELNPARSSRSRRWVGSVLRVFVAVALVWILFQLLGLRIVRVSRDAEPVRQSRAFSQEEDVFAAPAAGAESPRNLILFLADGLGFAHLSASRAALHGVDGPTVWDRFTSTGWQWTQPVYGFVTGSAAAATALATGYPTSVGSIGVDAEGRPLENLFQRASELGYRTGLVTDSYVWDASPAAFLAQSTSRANSEAESLLRQIGSSKLEVLAGELEDVAEGSVPDWQASVALLGNRFEVLGPKPSDSLLESLARSPSPTAAIFREDQVNDLGSEPSLPELSAAALRRLSSDDRPFLLLVESEEVDSASHNADFDRLLRGMKAIEATLDALLDFASEDGETLLVFTSDHETGGLALADAGSRHPILKSIWSTNDHTGVSVPVLAFGPGSVALGGIHANWELGRLLARSLRATDEPDEETN